MSNNCKDFSALQVRVAAIDAAAVTMSVLSGPTVGGTRVRVLDLEATALAAAEQVTCCAGPATSSSGSP